jgi:hypothetical protein
MPPALWRFSKLLLRVMGRDTRQLHRPHAQGIAGEPAQALCRRGDDPRVAASGTDHDAHLGQHAVARHGRGGERSYCCNENAGRTPMIRRKQL